jgi:hypothetical protein
MTASFSATASAKTIHRSFVLTPTLELAVLFDKHFDSDGRKGNRDNQ